VRLQDADFRAQYNKQRPRWRLPKTRSSIPPAERSYQDARIMQAGRRNWRGEADIVAAEAGNRGGEFIHGNARSGIEATKADVQRTLLERRRRKH